MGQFSSGVAVVTAVHQRSWHAMTATSLASVSLDPPMVLICVGKASRFHPAVVAAEAWAVSILGVGQRRLAEHFADRSRDLTRQFDGVPHHLSPGAGTPVIDGALGWLECTTYARHEAGDHTIVVGRLLWASGGEPAVEAPLTYHRGRYSDPGEPCP